MAQTLNFSEKNKGWTGESPFTPGGITSLNNRFFTLKNGQLYLHNDKDNDVKCNFYGQQFTARIKTVFNDVLDSDKIFKNLILEGDAKWKSKIETNFVKTTVRTSEFVTQGSKEFAFLRQEESTEITQGGDTQGIGNINTVNNLIITVGKVPDNTNNGDALFQVVNNQSEFIGIINSHTKTTITLNSIAEDLTLQQGSFCFIKKVSRIEGAEINGYYMEVTLELESTGQAELFAISTNAIKTGV
jgi:hypothetical protein